MLTFRANFKILQFDAKRYLKQFEIAMTKENKNAASAWLEAVIPAVPVRTGMAAANLLPLAEFLHEPFQIIPVNFPSRIAEGRAASLPPAEMFVSSKEGEFLFRFNIGVLHYLLNEFAEFGMGPYKNPIDPSIQPPWDSMVAGREAYINYVKTSVTKAIPRIKQFIFATKLDSGA